MMLVDIIKVFLFLIIIETVVSYKKWMKFQSFIFNYRIV